MIRVLRLMEYEFENYEAAEKHFAKTYVPANGMWEHPKLVQHMKIRSTILITPFSVSGDFPKEDEDGS